jgi:hypothetical protein
MIIVPILLDGQQAEAVFDDDDRTEEIRTPHRRPPDIRRVIW